MIKTKKIRIYKGAGKTNVLAAQKKSGVYLIYYGYNQTPVYIGQSGTDLYKTLTRHFQSWQDKKQVRVTYPQTALYKVRFVFCTPLQAIRLERYLILKLKPRDNPNKLSAYQLEISEQKIGEQYETTKFEEDYF